MAILRMGMGMEKQAIRLQSKLVPNKGSVQWASKLYITRPNWAREFREIYPGAIYPGDKYTEEKYPGEVL